MLPTHELSSLSESLHHRFHRLLQGEQKVEWRVRGREGNRLGRREGRRVREREGDENDSKQNE
jgi:hypothetical protein